MNVTIGELSSELLKYSNIVETTMVGNTPFTRALLATASNHVRVYMYIAQMKDGIYSARTDITDMFGARFFPTGNIGRPFVQEMDMIQTMFGGSYELDDRGITYINNADYYAFMNYFYHRLIESELIQATKSTLDTRILSLGINNIKIHSVIDKEFAEHNARTGTIGDLVTIVNKKREKFSIKGLREKDVQCVAAKLHSVGIEINTRGQDIVDVTFIRR